MTQPPPNPLLQPPFFQIPGIDPSSPISVQTEQIDQLNTLILQEIDANFAKIHQIITTRILPEIKRFAIAGEPTREAAKVRHDLMHRGTACWMLTCSSGVRSSKQLLLSEYNSRPRSPSPNHPLVTRIRPHSQMAPLPMTLTSSKRPPTGRSCSSAKAW